jgi:hypothetical protein
LCSKSFDLTDLKQRNSFGRQPIFTHLGPKVLDLSLVSKMVRLKNAELGVPVFKKLVFSNI